MSRTYHIRDRKKIAAAKLPVMAPKAIDPLCHEIRTAKELHEFYDRRMARADCEPNLPDVSGSCAAITSRCKELSNV